MKKQIAAMIWFLVMLLSMFRTFKTTETAATEYEIDEAINLGMQWLDGQQNVDGSWGTMDQVAKTGFAVLKFETHAMVVGENPLDPTYEYYVQVRNGLDYIFANASTMEISMQPAGDPDTDGDGFGVYFGSDFARTYETGIAMMAIAASTHPEMVVNVPGSSVDSWTYEEVAQDAVDYLAFGQTDAGIGLGGWSYEECNNTEGLSDNSNTGYAVLGLAYGEAPPPYGFGLTIPYFVKSELDIWIDYIQNDPGPLDDDGEIDPDGGSGYSDPNFWVNILKTGHLLCEMAFVGDTMSAPRVVNAIDYIVRHWNDADYSAGWRGPGLGGDPSWPACYQAMYTTMTGLEALGMDQIDGINWFDEFSDVLVAQQNSTDGSWPNATLFGNPDGTPAIWDTDQVISTEWALLTLQKAFPPVGKILYAGVSNPGIVYQYLGGTSWQTVSQGLGYAVLCLCEYEGHLYAGTMSTSDSFSGMGRVWRYDGGITWTLVGDNMDNQVCSLIVFRGNLYAGTAWGSGRLYRYDGGTTWTMVIDYTRQDGDPLTPWSGFRSLYVWNDILYIGDIGWDLFGHYDGTTFTYDADLGGSCIWDYEVYDNNLYASAFVGRVHRSSDGMTWTTIRDIQDYDSWELETFQGYLYVTTGPQLERYDGAGFSLVWTEPRGNETISMINAGNTLILGTGAEAVSEYGVPGVGRVYTYDETQVQLISGDMGSGIQTLSLGGVFPLPPQDLELHPREVVDLEDPTGTQWHELHPVKSRYYHLTSWEPGMVLSPYDQIVMEPVEPTGPLEEFEVDEVTVDLVVLDEGTGIEHWLDYKCGYWTFDPVNPISTKWNEIKPDLDRCWHLTSWEDFNMNGYLDLGDYIDMTPMYPFPGPVTWFHVEQVTVTLKLTSSLDFTQRYLEFMGTFDEFQAMDYLYDPMSTMWHEIWPEQGRIWHLWDWFDEFIFSPSDHIVLALKDEFGELMPGTEAKYNVDKLTVAMNLTSMLYEREHIVKFEGSLKQFIGYDWADPVSTQWHEANPSYCRQWHLTDWEDTNWNGILDYCDQIVMIDKETGWEEQFHVETLSTDIIVTPKVPSEHDVAVTNVTPSKTVVGQGYHMNVTVTVWNQGDFMETFNVTAYYSNETLTPVQWDTFWSWGDVNRDGYIDDIDVNLFSAAYGSTPGDPNWNPDADLNQDGHVDIDDLIILEDHIGLDIWTESNILGGSIGRQTVNHLPPGSTTLVFTWNTTGVPHGNYIISAKATRIIGETDVEDNTLIDGTVFVTITGDVNGDGSVDASDLRDLTEAYGSKPADDNWNPNCDLNNDGKIDASDLFDLSKNYGQTI